MQCNYKEDLEKMCFIKWLLLVQAEGW